MHLKIPHALSAIAIVMTLAGCTANQQEGAARGAGAGALAGAAGSMMTALVFGGDVGEAAARGAVYGASAGAVGGAIAGSSKDKREAEQRRAAQEKQAKKLRSEIGDDAFDGIVALVQCKHEVALAYGKTAARSNNDDYALAGLWLQALVLEDQQQEAALNAIAPQIMQADRRISSSEVATDTLESYKSSLRQIRAEFSLSEDC